MTMRRVMMFLWLLVGLAPLICVWLGGWTFLVATDRADRFLREPGVTVFQSLLAAAPFLVLAILSTIKLKPAASSQALKGIALAGGVGIVLALVLWGVFYFDAYTYWRDQRGGGVNIGLALLMLVSPILVGIAMYLSYRISMREKSTESESSGKNNTYHT